MKENSTVYHLMSSTFISDVIAFAAEIIRMRLDLKSKYKIYKEKIRCNYWT